MAKENVMDNNGKVRNPNEKFFYFDPKEARQFNLDAKAFLSVVLYKKVQFSVSFKNPKEMNVSNYARTLIAAVKQIVSGARLMDVKELKHDIPTNIAPHKICPVITLFIPYTGMLAKTLNNFYETLTTLNNRHNGGDLYNADVRFHLNAYDNATFNVEPNNNIPNTFIKGFSILSHMDAIVDKKNPDKIIVPANDFIKSALYIDGNVGVTLSDIEEINRYCMNAMKLNMFNFEQNEQKERSNNYITSYNVLFKNRITLIIYQIHHLNEDGSFCVKRNKIGIRIRYQQIYQTYVPTGVSIISEKDDIEITSLHQIFSDEEGSNVLIKMFENDNVDENSFAFKQFNTDLTFFDDEILSSFIINDDKDEEETENEETSETTVEETPKEEEKPAKKSRSRKKKTEEVKEEQVQESEEQPVDFVSEENSETKQVPAETQQEE